MTAAGRGKRLAGSGAMVGSSSRPGLTVAVTGVRAIDRRLKRLEPKLQKKVLRQSMRKAMKLIQAEVKANARAAFTSPTPSGRESKSTGATVKGVKVRATKGGRKRVGIDVRINGGAYVDKTFYAAFHEYGTRTMAARPIMAPAYAAKKREARYTAMRAMLDGLNAAVKTLRKT